MHVITMNTSQLSRTYNNLHSRCYNENVHAIKPWYRDCTICDEWYSGMEPGADQTGRQNFYDWVNDGNFYVIEDEPTVELDHNILVKGNTVYGPDTAIFCPKSINSMMAGFQKKSDDDLPQGVKALGNGKYGVNVRGIHDVFSTPEDAWKVWAERAKSRIVTRADDYYGLIPMRLYDALINWQFEITD